ncbi:MAG: TusE/DsrC/DsvC family sulfur relay protein [Candidatus Saccharicenans sp.]|nr:TusE/DsrC/DsvC family sulfur relay protein [Candidatus Saccharicenans sp.]
MTEIEFKGTRLKLNEEGFLATPEIWDEEIACFLARQAEGIEQMTEEHWKIVNYIRNYYLQKGQAPMIRKMVAETGISLKRIYELFPSGPAKGACKVAGLPKPDGCV